MNYSAYKKFVREECGGHNPSTLKEVQTMPDDEGRRIRLPFMESPEQVTLRWVSNDLIKTVYGTGAYKAAYYLPPDTPVVVYL